MTSAQNRRQPRVEVHLDITLQTPQGDAVFKTRNASTQGVFLLSPRPLPLRKLIRLKIRLSKTEEIQMLGLVAHTINPVDAAEQRRQPGMGIQLFSVGEQTRDRWHDFISEQYEKSPEARAQAQDFPHVRIRIPNRALLERFFSIDLPAGGIYLRTPDLHPQGSVVCCDVVHPETNAVFELQATVAQTVPSPVRDRGMKLQFADVENLEELRQFVYGPPTPSAP